MIIINGSIKQCLISHQICYDPGRHTSWVFAQGSFNLDNERLLKAETNVGLLTRFLN